jgi:F-type H+-transporting ATPase subunit gamma
LTTSLETLRKRITTTEQLYSVVRTMKALSAVNVRHYVAASEAVAGYQANVECGLHAVLRQQRMVRVPREHHEGPAAMVVFGSDHGLCGRFNEAVVGHALAERGDARERGEPLRLLAVGARAAARLEAAGAGVETVLTLPGAVAGLTTVVQNVLVTLDRWRAAGIGRVLAVHNQRLEHVAAVPTTSVLLPVDWNALGRLAAEPWTSRSLPAFTMTPDRLLSALLRQRLFAEIYRAGAESLASEHASRVAAMQAAQRNIEEHLQEMQVEFRQVRQQAITEEILEVSSGFEAMTRAGGAYPAAAGSPRG